MESLTKVRRAHVPSEQSLVDCQCRKEADNYCYNLNASCHHCFAPLSVRNVCRSVRRRFFETTDVTTSNSQGCRNEAEAGNPLQIFEGDFRSANDFLTVMLRISLTFIFIDFMRKELKLVKHKRPCFDFSLSCTLKLARVNLFWSLRSSVR